MGSVTIYLVERSRCFRKTTKSQGPGLRNCLFWLLAY